MSLHREAGRAFGSVRSASRRPSTSLDLARCDLASPSARHPRTRHPVLACLYSTTQSRLPPLPPTNFAPNPSLPPLDRSATPAILLGVAATTLLIGYQVYHYLCLYESPPIFDPAKFVPFTLLAKRQVSPDAFLLTFRHENRREISGPTAAALDWPVASHVDVKEPSMQAFREYTPVRVDHTEFDLLVRRYEGGAVSRWLVGTKVGNKVDMRGPVTTLNYRPNLKREIGMIAGGTGVTPMYQILARALSTPTDSTVFHLLHLSRTPEDSLLLPDLLALAAAHPGRLKVYPRADVDGQGWTGAVGRVDDDALRKTMPAPGGGNDVLVLVCGPDGMLASLAGPRARDNSQGPLDGALRRLGYTAGQVYKL